MIKVLLADDEPLIIRGVRKLVNWNRLGIEIVGECFDGTEALNLILNKSPDLAIIDICMPGLSGLEVLQQIGKRQLVTKVIFISAHHNFSYAKSALSLGAVEYILKPIDVKIIDMAIKKAISIIRNEQKQNKISEYMSAYGKNENRLSYESSILSLFEGSVDEVILQNIIEYLKIDISNKIFFSVVIRINRRQAYSQSSGNTKEQLKRYVVFDMIKQYITKNNLGYVFIKENNICILNYQDVGENYIDYFTKIYKQLKIEIEKNYNQSVTISVGKIVLNIKDISISYRTALEALELKYFLDKNDIITEQSFHTQVYDTDFFNREMKNVVNNVLPTFNLYEINSKIDYLMNIVWDITFGRREACISYCFLLISDLHRQLRNIGFEINEFKNRKSLFNDISTVDSFRSLKKVTTEYFTKLLKNIVVDIKEKKPFVISKIKQYVEQNYHANVTLEEASKIACMSPSYFSRFFKKYMGTNFIKYVTGVKMENSLRILLNTDCLTYEIADRVGYQSARHFSDMFKKYYGKNPMDYKKQIFEKI